MGLSWPRSSAWRHDLYGFSAQSGRGNGSVCIALCWSGTLIECLVVPVHFRGERCAKIRTFLAKLKLWSVVAFAVIEQQWQALALRSHAHHHPHLTATKPNPTQSSRVFAWVSHLTNNSCSCCCCGCGYCTTFYACSSVSMERWSGHMLFLTYIFILHRFQWRAQ